MNKPHHEVEALTIEEEKAILIHSLHQPTFGDGVQKWFVYFCSVIILIRGHSELCKVVALDFIVGVDVNKVSRHSFDFILTLNLFYLKLELFDYLIIKIGK